MTEISHLERAFLTYWLQLAPGYPPPVAEYTFEQGRRYRFDYAWIDLRIAVELEGIGGGKSRHTNYAGYSKDCEKYNLAAFRGWKVFRFTSSMLMTDPTSCIDLVAKSIDQTGLAMPVLARVAKELPY